mgnify:CR=1 FL=1|jgi:hypothetical protein
MSAVIFVLFIMIFINALLKSIREKKMIEDARMRRPAQLRKQEPVVKYENEELFNFEEIEEDREIEAVEDFEIPDAYDYGLNNDNISDEGKDIVLDYMEIDSKVKVNKLEDKKVSLSKKTKHSIQKDLLRGVIFSEVLSDPKSVRYMRR